MNYKQLIPSLSGNAIEWFDYLLYVYLAPTFSMQFFHTQNKMNALIISLAIFAISNVARPIGGFFIGLMSDAFGRRKALLLTIIMMTSASLAMSLVPTYETIGAFAPFLLLLIRLVQSLAVSGEFNATSVYLYENASNNKPSFYTSLVSASATFGVTIGATSVYCLHLVLSESQISSWGWRLPFLLAALCSAYIGYLRFKHCNELTNNKKNRPLLLALHLFKNYKTSLLMAFAYTSILSIGNYFIFSYFNIYQTELLHFDTKVVMSINIICLLLSIIAIPLFGILADKQGRKKCVNIGLISLLITTPVVFFGLSSDSVITMFMSEFVFVMLISMIAASLPMTLNHLFPKKIRNTGSAFAYNMAMVLFGGTAPLVAVSLVRLTHINIMPGLYFTLCCVLVLAADIITKAKGTELSMVNEPMPAQS